MSKIPDIKRELLRELRSGKYRPGDAFLPESKLASFFSISRETLRKAMGELVSEGILERQQGRGTFVKRLAVNRNPLIGLLFLYPSDENAIFSRTIRVLSDIFSANSYSIVLGFHHNSQEKAREQIERFIQLNVAGVIITPLLPENDQEASLSLLRRLNNVNIPFVLADTTISPFTKTMFSCVSAGNFQGMLQMINYLTSNGYTRIAHIGGQPGYQASEERMFGYLEGLRQANLPVRPEYIHRISANSAHNEAREFAVALMSLPEPPQVITCVYDIMAHAMIEELGAMGIDVPAQVGVTGFDNRTISGTPSNFLTTLEQPIEKMGQELSRIILEKINGVSQREEQLELNCQLIVRKSCLIPAPSSSRQQ